MTQAKIGSVVSIKFTGKLRDGETFGRATADKPLSFTVGKGEILPGVEEAIVGMSPGESKSTTIPADQGFGARKEERVVRMDRSEIPDNLDTTVGGQVRLTTAQGESVPARVVEKTEAEVVLDANHPLAGEELTFDLEVLEVR